MWHLVPRHQLSLPATIHKTCVTHQHASTRLHWEGCLWTLFTEEAPSTKTCPHCSVAETAREYMMVRVRLVLKCLLSRRRQRQHWKQAIRETAAYLKTLEIWRTLTLVAPEETQRSLTFSQLTRLHWLQTMVSFFKPSFITCAATWEKTNEYTSPQNSRQQLAPECRVVFPGLLFKQQLQLKFLWNNVYILGLNTLQSCLAYGGYKHGKNKCV